MKNLDIDTIITACLLLLMVLVVIGSILVFDMIIERPGLL